MRGEFFLGPFRKCFGVVPESEGSRFAEICRATDGCTVATKGMLHSPRARLRARWTRMAVWGFTSACRLPGTEDPSYAFLPRAARLVRRRGWWASIGKRFCAGGGLILSSRNWSRSRWRGERTSGRSGCGSGIRFEASARQRAKDTAENRTSLGGSAQVPGTLRMGENRGEVEFQLARSFRADTLLGDGPRDQTNPA